MPNPKSKLKKSRHSTAHLLAYAVKGLFPEAKLGMGPAIKHGFYYDFDLNKKLTDSDLEKIQTKITELIKDDIKFEPEFVSVEKAKKIFKDEPYKLELINDLKSKHDKISVYRCGDFVDLCSGPHITSAKKIDFKALKIDRQAGAYWKNSEDNKMLTRIYGLLFSKDKSLKQFLKNRELAKKRDHRILGKKLGLFIFSDLIGSGLPIYTEKGAIIRKEIQDFTRSLRKQMGYKEVYTPQVNKADLFKLSGHYDKYKDDMFTVKSNYSKEEFFLKPMNCPQHCQVYASSPVSYRDLPIRIADFAGLYRDEKPGELSGLTRLRAFSQDDGHCFCTPKQLTKEFFAILKSIQKAMEVYGLDYYIRLSLRDEAKKEKYLGDDKIWEKSQTILKDILKENEIEYKIAEGEAAFYGPKMDLVALDSLEREWQLSTIQLDLNMPSRFKLKYTDKDGKKQSPIMIHSAIVGSPERFMAILIEHYNGALPLWLSPVQVEVLPVSTEKHLGYAKEVSTVLGKANIRVSLNKDNESISKKIRRAQKQRIPYVLVVGDKEEKDKKVAVRKYGVEKIKTRSLDEFKEIVYRKIKEKK